MPTPRHTRSPAHTASPNHSHSQSHSHSHSKSHSAAKTHSKSKSHSKSHSHAQTHSQGHTQSQKHTQSQRHTQSQKYTHTSIHTSAHSYSPKPTHSLSHSPAHTHSARNHSLSRGPAQTSIATQSHSQSGVIVPLNQTQTISPSDSSSAFFFNETYSPNASFPINGTLPSNTPRVPYNIPKPHNPRVGIMDPAQGVAAGGLVFLAIVVVGLVYRHQQKEEKRGMESQTLLLKRGKFIGNIEDVEAGQNNSSDIHNATAAGVGSAPKEMNRL